MSGGTSRRLGAPQRQIPCRATPPTSAHMRLITRAGSSPIVSLDRLTPTRPASFAGPSCSRMVTSYLASRRSATACWCTVVLFGGAYRLDLSAKALCSQVWKQFGPVQRTLLDGLVCFLRSPCMSQSGQTETCKGLRGLVCSSLSCRHFGELARGLRGARNGREHSQQVCATALLLDNLVGASE